MLYPIRPIYDTPGGVCLMSSTSYLCVHGGSYFPTQSFQSHLVLEGAIGVSLVSWVRIGSVQRTAGYCSRLGGHLFRISDEVDATAVGFP